MPDILKNEDVKILQQGSLDLMVESYSNATRTLQIRGMTREQAISADIVTSSDRSLVTSIIDITDTPIFLTARTSGRAVKRGALYIKVSLRVDGVVVALLMAGYVAETHKVAYPGGDFEGSTDGPGLIREITGTDPVAGAEISETVPVGARWRIISVAFTFVNDATVANRRPAIQLDNGAIIVYKFQSIFNQVASETYIYIASAAPRTDTLIGNDIPLAIPPDVILGAGAHITTVTIGKVAGDNYSAPRMLIEEWIDP